MKAVKKQNVLKKRQQNEINKFKGQYFSYYDDVKIYSHKIIDW